MIIYTGISGSGKGTQCELIAKALGYVHLSMSDLIKVYADVTQQEKIHRGILLDDEDAIAIVEAALKVQADPSRVILDGFPRTLRQAGWLIDQGLTGAFRVEAIVNLLLPEEEALARLRLRGRADDTPEAIKSRFGWYTTNVLPTVDYFRQQQVPVYDIDGSGTPKTVFEATINRLRAATIVS